MQKNHLPVVGFLLVVGSLLFLDYQNETAGANSFFLTSIIQEVIRPGTIDEALLTGTSLEGLEITHVESSKTFFDPYLQLPEATSSRRYHIDTTSITISEFPTQNPAKLVQALLEQENPEYQFNKINPGTFYLNQVPLEKKTHNFLGIVIKERLYGFQYLPEEHQKVLEIIDALQQNE
ncbi:MAG: hypothetical protein AB7J40_03350 [Candidatus Altimarinota bacterium]